MRERPILFSAPMVRAILDGRKTQTRRVIKNVPRWDHYGRDIMDWDLSGIHQEEESLVGTDRWHLDVQCDVDDHSREVIRCPYGAPGDRLWVKETIRKVADHGDGYASSEYLADGAPTVADAWPWQRSTLVSIHCPRGLSRIDLEVTGVRVERLRSCSEADAAAEGLRWRSAHQGWTAGDDTAPVYADPRHAYAWLWESINGAGSWDADPFVWVVEFQRVRP